MNQPTFSPVCCTTDELLGAFDRMAGLRIGVIGDFALDLYYDHQPQTGEQSLETGLDVHWGHRPRASLGAAGNVVQNLLALGVGQVWVLGCVGPDLFGRELRHLFSQQGVRTDYLLTAGKGWDTCVYTKPMQGDRETNRLDFGNRNELSDEGFRHLTHALDELLPQLDVLVVNQQFRRPLLTPDRIEPINLRLRRHPALICVADLRDSGAHIRGATLKVNTAELARFLGWPHPEVPSLDWCLTGGRALSQQLGNPVVITRGEAGILFVGPEGFGAVDGLQLPGPLDTVGAGDTVVAALAATLSEANPLALSLTLANLAAAVTVQKTGQTGTAAPTEILNLLATYSVPS